MGDRIGAGAGKLRGMATMLLARELRVELKTRSKP